MGRDRHKKKREARELGLNGTGQEEEDETCTCYYCNKECRNEQALLLHQKAVHFKCEECNRKVAGIAGLKVHCQTVHREPLQRIPGAIKSREDPKIEVYGLAGVPEQFLPRKMGRVDEWSGMPPPHVWGGPPPPHGMMMPLPHPITMMGPGPPGPGAPPPGVAQFLAPLPGRPLPPGGPLIGIPGHLVNISKPHLPPEANSDQDNGKDRDEDIEKAEEMEKGKGGSSKDNRLEEVKSKEEVTEKKPEEEKDKEKEKAMETSQTLVPARPRKATISIHLVGGPEEGEEGEEEE